MTTHCFSRRANLERFAEVRTPGARRAFCTLIDNLAKIDNEDPLRLSAFAYEQIIMNGRGEETECVYTLLRRAFTFGLEWPQERRRKLSPRLDLSRIRTYGEAAKAVYSALLEAAKLGLVASMGDDALPDAEPTVPRIAAE